MSLNSSLSSRDKSFYPVNLIELLVLSNSQMDAFCRKPLNEGSSHLVRGSLAATSGFGGGGDRCGRSGTGVGGGGGDSKDLTLGP